MSFLKISKNTTLTDIADAVGSRNVDSVLSLNSLSRTMNISKAMSDLCDKVKASTEEISNQKKIGILNNMISDAEVFENAALLDSDGWKILASIGTFANMLKIPDTITLPESRNVFGGSKEPVKPSIYTKVMDCLAKNLDIDPGIFNEYSNQKYTQIADTSNVSNPIQWFNLPWGKVTLYSSLSGESVDFPVYPQELSDGRTANYDTMPDMLYQYEPWQIYKSSGPRSCPLTFEMHRDMWTGDHRDGKCNELIRFCEANCYPKYNGASVNTSTVVLYINGQPFIRGVMTEVKPNWSGPIGLDGFYLYVELTISITEVSDEPLNYDTVRKKGLIG